MSAASTSQRAMSGVSPGFHLKNLLAIRTWLSYAICAHTSSMAPLRSTSETSRYVSVVVPISAFYETLVAIGLQISDGLLKNRQGECPAMKERILWWFMKPMISLGFIVFGVVFVLAYNYFTRK